MEFRVLGKTNLNVSRLSMGTMTFGGQVAEDECVRMVDRCLEHGINFFDTANVYNQGRAETVLGNALRGRRHTVVLATKVRGRMGDDPDDAGLSRPAIRKAIHDSLQRLATDYVDLYYLHQPDYDTRIDETLAVMDELVQEGKIRYPAVSNYASWQVLEMLWKCENRAYVPPTVSQPMYNVLARGIEQEHIPFCRQYGIAIVPYNPLAGGLLTGKYVDEQSPVPGTRFDGNELYQNRYWRPEYFTAVASLKGIADAAGIPLIALALRWLLSQPAVDSIILGASKLSQFDENVKACEGGVLDAALLRECDAVWEALRGVAPKYNR
jgi:aryl-alcohol dehydrogenase-like predicted oxidoreductase